MSDRQDDTTGDGGRAGGDQPQAEQPAGGQPGQEQAYRRGPGVGDIFSIPETVTEMKVGLALNVLISVGLAFVALGVSTLQTGFGSGVGGAVGGGLAVFSGPLVLAPLIAVVIGLRQAEVLENQPGNILYANALVTTVVGTFLMMLLTLILGSIIAGSGNLGDAIGQMLLPFVISAIGAGLVAAGAVWVDTNVLPGPSAPADPQAGQGQPR